MLNIGVEQGLGAVQEKFKTCTEYQCECGGMLAVQVGIVYSSSSSSKYLLVVKMDRL